MKKPNLQTYKDLDQIIIKAGFPNNLEQIRAIAKQTFENIEENLDKPYHLHKGTRPNRDGFGAPLPHGQRDETLLRHHLISELFRIWMLGHDTVPEINNKDYPATPFVIFVEAIFKLLKIGKIEAHLEEFQSYRKAILKNINLE